MPEPLYSSTVCDLCKGWRPRCRSKARFAAKVVSSAWGIIEGFGEAGAHLWALDGQRMRGKS